MRRLLARPEAVVAALVVLAFAAGAAASLHFLDAYYLLDQLAANSEAGLLVLGMTFVIVAGEIDLSVASSLALCACISAKAMGAGLAPAPAVALSVALGAALGALNGLLVAYGKLPSFLVTLGTLACYRGAAQALMGASSAALPSTFVGLDARFLPLTGVPVPVGILTVLAVAAAFALHRTVQGRWVYAVGASEPAARFSSVPTERVKFWVFVGSGALAGLGAVMMDSRLGVARYDHARGLELTVITATVLGGASIYGGRGTILGSALALLLMVLIQAGMGLANVKAEYQLAIIGTILVLAVGASMLTSDRDA